MIAAEQLLMIVAEVEHIGPGETVLASLRQQHPGVHFTYCMDDDITVGRAVVERPGFNVYLVDSSDHCSTLTTDAGVATGVVIAEVFGE